MISRKDLPPLLLLLLALLVQFAPVILTGRTYFLGDLTYFYHPWHALSAQELQAGRLPLWNPFGYMGMPLLASMQTGTFAPSTLPFHLFSYATAYKLHLAFCHGLAAFMGYLWLRQFAGRAGAFAGSAVFALGGVLLSKLWLPNQAATLIWLPAVFLFSAAAAPLGLALACSLAAGYPQMWAGMLLAAVVLPWGKGGLRTWGFAGAIAVGLAACMLLPGLEFSRLSNRGSGLALEQRTQESYRPGDLTALVTPLAVARPDPSGAKYPVWKTVYVGITAASLAILGLLCLNRRAAILALAFLSLVLLLMLGRENPLSLWLWSWLPPLGYIRFPANLAYLVLPVLLPLIALGLRRRSWGGAVALLIAAELLVYGWRVQPTVLDRSFSDRGPLAAWLQDQLEGHRFAMAPRAALLLRGKGKSPEEEYDDVKNRLYGSSNLPFRIAGTTGMGESVLLGASYRVMDFLFTRPSAGEAMRYLPWLDAKHLLTKEPAAGLEPAGNVLWNIYQTSSPARAWWVPGGQEHPFLGSIGDFGGVREAMPLRYTEPRPDRWRTGGRREAEGWVFVSNPLYPDWKVYLQTPSPVMPAGSSGHPGRPPVPAAARRVPAAVGMRASGTVTQEMRSVPALEAFQIFAVPRGSFSIKAAYRPGSVRWGILLSAWSAAALAIWGWVTLRRLRPEGGFS